MGEPLIDVGSVIAMVGLAISVITLYLNQRKTKKELKLTKDIFKSYPSLLVLQDECGTKAKRSVEP
jgi:hypothetical protein